MLQLLLLLFFAEKKVTKKAARKRYTARFREQLCWAVVHGDMGFLISIVQIQAVCRCETFKALHFYKTV
jgi:hypothetical protein